MNLLDNEKITVPCPTCGHEFNVTIKEVKEEALVACPACAAVSRLENKEVLEAIRKMEDQLLQLQSAFAAMPKKG